MNSKKELVRKQEDEIIMEGSLRREVNHTEATGKYAMGGRSWFNSLG